MPVLHRTLKVNQSVASIDSFVHENQRSCNLRTCRDTASCTFKFSPQDLETWVRSLLLLFWHTEHWKVVEGLKLSALYNSIPLPRNLRKTNKSCSDNHTCACSRWKNSRTMIDPGTKRVSVPRQGVKDYFAAKSSTGLAIRRSKSCEKKRRSQCNCTL